MEEEFLRIVRRHTARYPQMQPQDYAKLAYQSEYGPEHLITDEAAAAESIRAEWSGVPALLSEPPVITAPEPIGNGLCRYHLSGPMPPDAAECLAWLFCRSAREHTGTREGLAERLILLETLHIHGLAGWLTGYRTRGMPAVHHSPLFRAEYRPHYRVIKSEYANFFPALPALFSLNRLAQKSGPVLAAIDGQCGSGKSSLAALAGQMFGCNLLHTDDFYLPIAKRSPGWEQTPGGNMDFARLRREALEPALAGRTIDYKTYDCQEGRLLPAVRLAPTPLTIIEGSYSTHPALGAPYALKIFLHCAAKEQERRLRRREGDYFSVFQKRWIPLEEGYFAQYAVRQRCDLVLDTSAF